MTTEVKSGGKIQLSRHWGNESVADGSTPGREKSTYKGPRQEKAGNDKELNKAINQCRGAMGTQCKNRQKQKMSDTLCLVGHTKS